MAYNMFPPRLPRRPRRRNDYRRHVTEEMEELYEFITDRYFEWQYMKDEEEKKKKEEDKSKKETFFQRKFTFGQMLLHSMWIGPLVGSLYFGFIYALLQSRGLI